MCSSSSASATPCSLFLRSTAAPSLLLLRRRNLSILRSENPNKTLRLSASLADKHLDISWLSPPASPSDVDNYKGWAIVEHPPNNKKKGLPTIVTGGIGTCAFALLAAIGYISLSRKGFKLQFRGPLSAFHGIITPIETDKADKTETNVLDENVAASELAPERISDVSRETLSSAPTEKLERVKLSMIVDSTQMEALSVLKKLKIIEDDVRADELCTRREYTRWLVRLNLLLERNPKHRIVPSVSLSGSVIAAFDDVGVEDPDFEAIQALAEAGIIPSKLSGTNSCSASSEGDGSFCFYPERFISRKDLINWKAQLEYGFLPGVTERSRYQEQK